MCTYMLFIKNGGKTLRQSVLLALIIAESFSVFAISFGPPSKVEDAFKLEFPTVEDVKWESSDNKFIAQFKEKHSLIRVFFDSLGNLLESEQEIPVEELPEKVILYIKTQDETAKILKAYKINKKEGRTKELYDVVAKVHYKKSTFTISKDGYLTSR
jgi:hypothetical protein